MLPIGFLLYLLAILADLKSYEGPALEKTSMNHHSTDIPHGKITHLEPNCTGDCLCKLAATLDLLAPASDVPHQTIVFEDNTSECLFALGVRITPTLMNSGICTKGWSHTAEIAPVGNCLVLRLTDDPACTDSCGCSRYLWTWEPSTTGCMLKAFYLWNDLQDASYKEDLENWLREKNTLMADVDEEAQTAVESVPYVHSYRTRSKTRSGLTA
ncbi:hypothetical protein AAF712_005103 [Marasmius tenuissimus]|uniref:Secreted protein n=1 Tax=Marasmius tenuissimus TaxID=585030 RepID=A0ABR3A3P6_9AGAR